MLEDREEIVRVLTRGMPVEGVDARWVAEQTEGISGTRGGDG